MKKAFLFCLVFLGSLLMSQTTTNLKFETIVPDAENFYIAIPTKTKDNFEIGYIYFDETAGYTFHSYGTLTNDTGNENFKKNDNTGFIIARINNLALKVALLSPEKIQKLGLELKPSWLKNYQSDESEQEKSVNRASHMNGNGFPQFALPKLLKLYNQNYKTEKLFFELAFSYNALGKFSESEKITTEALKVFSNDLLIKEHVFALLNQQKINETETFLNKNLLKFKSESYKAEAIANTIAYHVHFKNIESAKKWLSVYRKEIKKQSLLKNAEELEKLILSNDKISK